MSNWALVEDNNIKGVYTNLPENWKNISGLYRLENDVEFLRSLGWYKIVKQHQTYDATQLALVGYEHSIVENEVIETLRVQPRPPVQKNRLMDRLRKERNKLLQESDWTQLFDTQQIFDEQTKNKWTVYRQALRDLPQTYENLTISSYEEINWPQL
jgi:hypothetical protein